MPKFLVFATLLAALFLSVLVGAVTTVMLSGPSDRSERQLGIEVVEHPLRPDNSIADKVPEQTGVLRHHADRTSTGFTLYSTVDPARRVNLLNMAGEIVHSWTTPSELLPDEEQLSPTAVSQLPVIHPQLLSGGDIVLAIQRDTMLQKPGGIARMDKDSKVKWLLPGLVGHALNVTANDKVYGVLHGAIEQPLPGYVKHHRPYH